MGGDSSLTTGAQEAGDKGAGPVDHTESSGRLQSMRYHEELNRARGVLFYVASVVLAFAFLIDYVRR